MEPPRRGFVFGKNRIFQDFGHVNFLQKMGFRQKLDFWVIKKIKIGAKAQPGSALTAPTRTNACMHRGGGKDRPVVTITPVMGQGYSS